MRNLGNVQRDHIITKMRKEIFEINQKIPQRLPSKYPGIGLSQPPRKRREATPATINILAYSARKKNDQRIPEYSVIHPATSSDSASGRSKGVRFTSATPATKKIQKAIKVNANYEQGYCNLGKVYYLLSDIKKSIKYYKKAAKLGQTEAQDWLKENDHSW